MIYCSKNRFYWIFTTVSVFCICLINIIACIFIPSVPECICKQCSENPNTAGDSFDDVTFYSVPRARQKNTTLQRNLITFCSWLSASPKAKIHLYVDKYQYDPSGRIVKTIESKFGKNRITFGGDLKGDLDGVPYIDDWFIRGVNDATTKLVVFINADIMISPDWFKRVKQCFLALPNKPLVLINQRIDFTLAEKDLSKLRIDPHYLLDDIEAMVSNSPHSEHSEYGIDTFAFRADKLPFDPTAILPFVIGRYNWDNWLVGYLNVVADTLTFHVDPPVYHIDHKRHDFNPADDRVLINHHFRNANKKLFGSNADTKYEILNGKIVHRLTHQKYDLPPI